MSEIKVDVNQYIPDFLKLVEQIEGGKVFSHTLAAVDQIAIMYQDAWQKMAGGAPIPGTPRRIHSRGDYIRSIQSDLSGEEKVVYTDYGPHQYIESGHGEIDLKKGLLSGPKARMSKKGTPYNVVHFRHGVPGSTPQNRPMPLNVYQLIMKKTQEATNEKRQALSSQMQQGRRTQMHWTPTKGGLKPFPYTWKTGMYAGMVRVPTSAGKGKSSQYVTFRTVSVKSDPRSWILPPLEGIPIRQIVVDYVKPFAEQLIVQALQEDLSG